jgi:hypothetical protein
MQYKAISSFVKLTLFSGLAFYAGYSFSQLHDLFAYQFPENRSHVSLPTPSLHAPEKRYDFKPVTLPGKALAHLRQSLERKIFGGPRPVEMPSVRVLDTTRFVTAYAGNEVFERYYRTLFESQRIEVSEISGNFPEMQGYIWRSLLLRRVQKPSQKLFIYHQGHNGNPLAYRQPNSIITRMMESGYDILILRMPGYGWNSVEKVRVKTWDGWGYLPALLPDNHAPLAMVDTGDGHFSKFFVLPVMSSIDLALSQRAYQQITMLGHSGGGWTTTLSAAVDTRIDNSISYAGGLPFFARQRAVDIGDAEQFDTALYRDFPYTTLYELASWSAVRKRVHYQLYNKNDDCCFSGESAEIFASYLQTRPTLPERDLRMAIVNNSGHYMVVDAVVEIIRRIEASSVTELEARQR